METGVVEVTKIWPAMDVGKAIDPLIVDGQIHGAISGLAVQPQRRLAQPLQAGLNAVRVKRKVHRVTRLGVRQLKRQVRAGRQADPGAPQSDAGVSEVFQRFPRRGGDQRGEGWPCFSLS